MWIPCSTICNLRDDGSSSLVCRSGPVDAAYKAIDGLVRVDAELVDYSVNSVTEGIQALATTRVTIRPTGAMKDEAYVERAGGFGGKVQRTFSGKTGSFVTHMRLEPAVVSGAVY